MSADIAGITWSKYVIESREMMRKAKLGKRRVRNKNLCLMIWGKEACVEQKYSKELLGQMACFCAVVLWILWIIECGERFSNRVPAVPSPLWHCDCLPSCFKPVEYWFGILVLHPLTIMQDNDVNVILNSYLFHCSSLPGKGMLCWYAAPFSSLISIWFILQCCSSHGVHSNITH